MYRSIPKISRSVTEWNFSVKPLVIFVSAAAPERLPKSAQAVSGCCRKFLGGNMTSESILGLEENRNNESIEQAPKDSTDVRLNTLRETVLQLLDEVESLAISRPVDIKRGARFSDEVRQFEVSLIRTALGRTSGSQTRAAKLLGLKPTTLNAKIKRYGIMA
jgi:transcriptional regulator with GAF, ATPase, and Fis domain